jgi:hypothetical protein
MAYTWERGYMQYYRNTPDNIINNGSTNSFAAQQIRPVIPQVYSTYLVTGAARQISETEGAHDGYESSHSLEGWGEPDMHKNQNGTLL